MLHTNTADTFVSYAGLRALLSVYDHVQRRIRVEKQEKIKTFYDGMFKLHDLTDTTMMLYAHTVALQISNNCSEVNIDELGETLDARFNGNVAHWARRIEKDTLFFKRLSRSTAKIQPIEQVISNIITYCKTRMSDARFNDAMIGLKTSTKTNLTRYFPILDNPDVKPSNVFEEFFSNPEKNPITDDYIEMHSTFKIKRILNNTMFLNSFDAFQVRLVRDVAETPCHKPVSKLFKNNASRKYGFPVHVDHIDTTIGCSMREITARMGYKYNGTVHKYLRLFDEYGLGDKHVQAAGIDIKGKSKFECYATIDTQAYDIKEAHKTKSAVLHEDDLHTKWYSRVLDDNTIVFKKQYFNFFVPTYVKELKPLYFVVATSNVHKKAYNNLKEYKKDLHIIYSTKNNHKTSVITQLSSTDDLEQVVNSEAMIGYYYGCNVVDKRQSTVKKFKRFYNAQLGYALIDDGLFHLLPYEDMALIMRKVSYSDLTDYGKKVKEDSNISLLKRIPKFKRPFENNINSVCYGEDGKEVTVFAKDSGGNLYSPNNGVCWKDTCALEKLTVSEIMTRVCGCTLGKQINGVYYKSYYQEYKGEPEIIDLEVTYTEFLNDSNVAPHVKTAVRTHIEIGGGLDEKLSIAIDYLTTEKVETIGYSNEWNNPVLQPEQTVEQEQTFDLNAVDNEEQVAIINREINEELIAEQIEELKSIEIEELEIEAYERKLMENIDTFEDFVIEEIEYESDMFGPISVLNSENILRAGV